MILSDPDQAGKQLAYYGGMATHWMKILTRSEGRVFGLLLVGRNAQVWCFETTGGPKFKRSLIISTDMRDAALENTLYCAASLCEQQASLFE